MRARSLCFCLAGILLGPANVVAQNASIVVRVVERDSRVPLGFVEVSVPTKGIRRLTNESGTLVLRNLPAGEIGLRFRRIGFVAQDTVVTLVAKDTAQVQIGIARLAIQLPTVLVNRTCTDRTPFEVRTPMLAELFSQVRQNAEQLVLLAKERPFVIQASHELGPRGGSRPTPATEVFFRGPLPDKSYVPGSIEVRVGNRRGVKLPELADLASSEFTNNHCFWYEGETTFGSDSAIRIDFAPIPRVARGVDLEGSVYLRVDSYRLIGMVTRLNRIPREWRTLIGYATRSRFDEVVSGIPILAEWEITNTFKGSLEPTVVATGRMTGVRWLQSSK